MQAATPDVQLQSRDERSVDRRGPSPTSDRRLGGSSDRLLEWGTTVLLIVIGLVHLHLWQAGYRNASDDRNPVSRGGHFRRRHCTFHVSAAQLGHGDGGRLFCSRNSYRLPR